jgi:excisionase family DNA binding protein
MKNTVALQPGRQHSIGDRPLAFEQLPPVLTSREAANFLRVGVREVRTLVDTGQLAGTRLGPRKVIRISRDALLALMRVPSGG